MLPHKVELARWESYVGEDGFMVCSSATLADIMLGSVLTSMWRFGLDFTNLPKLKAYRERLEVSCYASCSVAVKPQFGGTL